MKIFDPKLTGSIEILNTITGDVTLAGNLNVEGGLGGAVTGSATASYVDFDNIDNKPILLSGSAQIASDISGSFTSLSSSVASELLKNTTDTLTGDLTVTGTLTAQEFHTEFTSASIIYESGSTQFGNSSDDTHQFTGSALVNGSVGVGTTSPSEKLHLVGSQRIQGDTGSLTFLRTDNLTQIGKIYDDSGFTIEGKANNNLILRTKANTLGEGIKFQDSSSNDLMFIDGTNGKVGIGTTSPNSLLHASGSDQNILEVDSSNSDGPYTVYKTAGTVKGYIGNAQGIMNSGTGNFGVRAQGDLTFSSGGGTERMRIDDEGLVILRSMGVNTTRNLVFEGDSNSTSGNAGAIGMFADGARLTSNYYYSGGQAKYVSGNGQASINLQTGTTAANTFIAFGVNPPTDAAGSTQRMRIGSSGLVTIGSSTLMVDSGNTNFNLEMSDGIAFGGSAFTYANIFGSSGNIVIAANAYPAQTGTESTITLRTASSGGGQLTPMVIKGPNVGIGTTSPTKLLDVNGAIRTRNSFNISDGTTQIGGLFPYKVITGAGSDNSTALFAETGLDLHFMTNGDVASKMIITAGGDVSSIGGYISSKSTPLTFTNSGTGTYNKTVIYNDSSNGLLFEAAKATDSNSGTKLPVTLTWRGNYTGNGGIQLTGTTKLYTNNTGLGINTTSPHSDLHVEGDISQTTNSKTIVFSKTLSDNVGTDIAGFSGYTGDPSAATILVTIVINASSGYAVSTVRYLWNLRKATAGRSRSVTTLTGADQGSVNSGVVSIASVTPVALYNSYERFRLSVNVTGISTSVIYVKMEAIGENIRGLNPM